MWQIFRIAKSVTKESRKLCTRSFSSYSLSFIGYANHRRTRGVESSTYVENEKGIGIFDCKSQWGKSMWDLSMYGILVLQFSLDK
jgi:hypothetical protein